MSSGRIALVIVLMTTFILIGASAVSAQEVQTWICTGPASISLVTPQSDSVQANGELVLSGEVAQANQIQVLVDGQLDSTIPLAFAATTYSATVHVSPGTHELTVTAIDSCQIADATATAVVTYQPHVTPTTGADTDTSTGGVIIGAPLRADGVVVSPRPWIYSITAPFAHVGQYLNLVDPVVSTAGKAPQLVRFGLVLFGASMLLFSVSISQWVLVRKWLNACSRAMGLGSAQAHRIIVIIMGGVMIWLAFLI